MLFQRAWRVSHETVLRLVPIAIIAMAVVVVIAAVLLLTSRKK